MKKLFLTIMVVIIAVFTFIGCTPAETTNTPTSTSPTSTEATEPAEVIELKFSHPFPTVSPQVATWVEWGEEVEELTGGQVKITFYHAGALVPDPDQWSALCSGVSDIAVLTSVRVPELEFETVFNLPLLGWSNENVLNIRKQVEEECPEIEATRSMVKTLWLEATTLETFHFVDKEVHVPADMKGMSVSTVVDESFLSNCGAVLVSVGGPSDIYPALEKGILDAVTIDTTGLYEFNLNEVTSIHLDVPTSTSVMDVLMNLDTWNSLPADVQKIIEETLPGAEQADYAARLKVHEEMYDKLISAEGHTIIKATEEETALWVENAQPTHQKWIAEMETKGYPAQEVYDKLVEVISTY